MQSLEQLKLEEARVGRQWLDTVLWLEEAASMRANEPDTGGLENFRRTQALAVALGRKRVELKIQIAVLERHLAGTSRVKVRA